MREYDYKCFCDKNGRIWRPNYCSINNCAVQAQFQCVDAKLAQVISDSIPDLLENKQGIPLTDITGMKKRFGTGPYSLLIIAREAYPSCWQTAARGTLSLGTARSITNTTKREISLLWDRDLKTNLVVTGTRGSVNPRGDLRISWEEFAERFCWIYHTHPCNCSSKRDCELARLPSQADFDVLARVHTMESPIESVSSLLVPCLQRPVLVRFGLRLENC